MEIEIKGSVILKDGIEIGKVEGSVVTTLEKIGPRIKGAIKQQLGADILEWKTIEADEPEDEPKPAKAKTATQDDGLRDTVKVLAEAVTALVGQKAAPQAVTFSQPLTPDLIANNRREEILHTLACRAAAGEIPLPPKTLPDMGDKTPVFVEWVRANTTEEDFNFIYQRRLQNGGLPTLRDREIGEKKRRDAQNKLPGEGDADEV